MRVREWTSWCWTAPARLPTRCSPLATSCKPLLSLHREWGICQSKPEAPTRPARWRGIKLANILSYAGTLFDALADGQQRSAYDDANGGDSCLSPPGRSRPRSRLFARSGAGDECAAHGDRSETADWC